MCTSRLPAVLPGGTQAATSMHSGFPSTFEEKGKEFSMLSPPAPSLCCWQMSQNSCCFSYCGGMGAKDSTHPERASRPRVDGAASSTASTVLTSRNYFFVFILVFCLASGSGVLVFCCRDEKCLMQQMYNSLALCYYHLKQQGGQWEKK